MVQYLTPGEAAVSAMHELAGALSRRSAGKPSQAGLYVGDDAGKRQIRLMGDQGGQLFKDSDASSGRKYDQTGVGSRL